MQIRSLHLENNKIFNSKRKSEVTDLNAYLHVVDMTIYPSWLVVHNLSTWKLYIYFVITIIQMQKIVSFLKPTLQITAHSSWAELI